MEGLSDCPMSQVPKKYLFSMKSLLVMCLLLALFGAANTIERSLNAGVHGPRA